MAGQEKKITLLPSPCSRVLLRKSSIARNETPAKKARHYVQNRERAFFSGNQRKLLLEPFSEKIIPLIIFVSHKSGIFTFS